MVCLMDFGVGFFGECCIGVVVIFKFVIVNNFFVFENGIFLVEVSFLVEVFI